MKIIVDAMGGDHSPKEIIKGSIYAVEEYNIDIIMVGNEKEISKELKNYDYNKESVKILHASDIITNEDDPAMAIRRKKDSSIVVGMNALKNGEADGFVSAGSTGAILAGALFIVKRIKGIKRAAITTIYPNADGRISLLVDAGANIDVKAEYLDQFALMASIFMERALNIKNPRVALANIGSEKEKGNSLSKESYKLLEANDKINFIGNIEGREIPNGGSDIIVADGFVGNMILKVSEGVAIGLGKELKQIFTSSVKSKLAAILLKSELKKFAKVMDYREYGGAPLLGAKKPIIVAHGSSDAYAIKNAIRQCISFAEKDIIETIEENINL